MHHVPHEADVFGSAAAAARGAGSKGRNGSAVPPASAPVGGAFVREGEDEEAWRWAHRTKEAETWVDTDTDADAEGSEGGLWEIEGEAEVEAE